MQVRSRAVFGLFWKRGFLKEVPMGVYDGDSMGLSVFFGTRK